MKTVGMIAVAVLLGCVLGGGLVQWRMNRSDAGAGAVAPTRSVSVNGQRLSDQEILALSSAIQGEVRDGDYWYDRANGSWGQRGGPASTNIWAATGARAQSGQGQGGKEGILSTYDKTGMVVIGN